MSGDQGTPGNSDLLKNKASVTIDCSGMYCPHPVMEIAKKLRVLQVGQVIELIATDPTAKSVIPDWCHKTGNKLLGKETRDNKFIFYVEKSK